MLHINTKNHDCHYTPNISCVSHMESLRMQGCRYQLLTWSCSGYVTLKSKLCPTLRMKVMSLCILCWAWQKHARCCLLTCVEWDILVCLVFCRNDPIWLFFPFVTSHIKNGIYFNINWCTPSTNEIWKKVTQGMRAQLHPYMSMGVLVCVWKKSHK